MSSASSDKCPQCLKNDIETEVSPGYIAGKPKVGDKVIDKCKYCGWRSERTYVGYRGEDKSSWNYVVSGRKSHKEIMRLRKAKKTNVRKRPRVHKL